MTEDLGKIFCMNNAADVSAFDGFLRQGVVPKPGLLQRLRNPLAACRLAMASNVGLGAAAAALLRPSGRRRGVLRAVEDVIFAQQDLRLVSAFPRVAQVLQSSRSGGGFDHRGQGAKLLEISALRDYVGARRCLELGSGVTSAMFACRLADGGDFETVEEAEDWRQKLLHNMAPFAGQFHSRHAKRVIATMDGDPVVHYDIDHDKTWDLVYVDGPTNKVADQLGEQQRRRAYDLDSEGRLANADVALMWQAGRFPSMVVVDGRRSTVRFLAERSQNRYAIFLRSAYMSRAQGIIPPYNLYHTVFLRRDWALEQDNVAA